MKLSVENEAVRSKNNAEPGASCNGASPLKKVGRHVGAIGGRHIMFERKPCNVFTTFKGELERKWEEVPLAKVGDLVRKEPGKVLEWRQ